jgi:O-antigen/teichoic acid export membrane protein
MTFVDRFLIGAALGAAAVALYSIPFNLVVQLVIGPGALAAAMFPRFAATDCETGRALSRRKLELLSYTVTPLSIVGICFVEPFLRLWIGSASAAVSTPVALVLVIGFWANSLAQLPYARLQAAERTDITAKIHMAEIVPYVIVLWVCVKYLGIVGAAVAWSLRCMTDALALAIIDKVGRASLVSIGFRGSLVIGTVGAFIIFDSSFERVVIVSTAALILFWHMQQKIPSEMHNLVQGLLSTKARGR